MATTRSVVSPRSSRRIGKPRLAPNSTSKASSLNDFQKSPSARSATPPSTAIVTTSRWRSAAACPKRKVSRPAWLAPACRWMNVSSTRPKPKNTESISPRALSYLTRVRPVTAITASVAAQPATAAPSISTSGTFEPVSRNARAMPGRAAWLMASPSRLCRRSTANVPSAPLVAPSTAAPSATVRNV